MRFFSKLKYNQKQLEKTADLSLAIAQYAFLTTVITFLIPGLGMKLGVIGFASGLVLFISAYVFSMWLLRR